MVVATRAVAMLMVLMPLADINAMIATCLCFLYNRR